MCLYVYVIINNPLENQTEGKPNSYKEVSSIHSCDRQFIFTV